MIQVSDKTSELCQEILYTRAHTVPQVFLGVEILLCFFIFLLIHNQFTVLKRKKFTTLLVLQHHLLDLQLNKSWIIKPQKEKLV